MEPPSDVTVRIEVTISVLHDNSGVGTSHYLQLVQSGRLHTCRQHAAQDRVKSDCHVAIVVVHCTLKSNMFTL